MNVLKYITKTLSTKLVTPKSYLVLPFTIIYRHSIITFWWFQKFSNVQSSFSTLYIYCEVNDILVPCLQVLLKKGGS